MNKNILIIGGASTLALIAALSVTFSTDEKKEEALVLNDTQIQEKEELDFNAPLPPLSERKINTLESLMEEAKDKEIVSGDEILDAKAEAWAQVDLEGMRQEMPDNIFWVMAAPTNDEAVLQERQENRKRMEDMKYKIVFNRATEEEIRAFYAEQEKISTDYVEFTSTILARYKDILPEDDVGMQNLARSMHLGKLQEYPKKLTQALERLELAEAQKTEWQADKAAYKAKLEAMAAEANRARENS